MPSLKEFIKTYTPTKVSRCATCNMPEREEIDEYMRENPNEGPTVIINWLSTKGYDKEEIFHTIKSHRIYGHFKRVLPESGTRKARRESKANN